MLNNRFHEAAIGHTLGRNLERPSFCQLLGFWNGMVLNPVSSSSGLAAVRITSAMASRFSTGPTRKSRPASMFALGALGVAVAILLWWLAR